VQGSNRIQPGTMVGAAPALCWPRRSTHHPGNAAITDQTGLQTRRPRHPARTRSLGPWIASHLRHRTRRLRSQRLHANEAARL
jgi:hypothetical protein